MSSILKRLLLNIHCTLSFEKHFAIINLSLHIHTPSGGSFSLLSLHSLRNWGIQRWKTSFLSTKETSGWAGVRNPDCKFRPLRCPDTLCETWNLSKGAYSTDICRQVVGNCHLSEFSCALRASNKGIDCLWKRENSQRLKIIWRSFYLKASNEIT